MCKTTNILISLLAFTISTTAMAQAVGEKFKFQTNYYLVTSLDPPTVAVTCQLSSHPYWEYSEEPYGEVVIRSSVTYKNTVFTVTAIGNYAFCGCSRIASILIPESVTSIGGCAFDGCSGLTSITFPDSVNFIGGYAFGYCTGLTSVVIPKLVTSIEGYTFFECSGLTSATLLGSVTSIQNCAFAECTNLSSINIPNSVTSIGEFAFSKCINLTSVTIPESVTSIGYGAFSSCRSLTSVTIPASLTSIGGGVFSYCISLTSIVIPESITLIGGGAFSNCTSLKSVTIPKSVRTISGAAFAYCTCLTSITLPASVKFLGGGTFGYCTGLTSIITHIEDPRSVTLEPDVFDGVPKGTDANACALYVPEASLSLYQNAWQWKDFLPNMFVGVEDTPQTSIVIYPNPASYLLNIKSNTPIFSFELYDALGRLMLSKTEMFNNESVIDVSSLTRGLYFIKLHTINSVAEHKVLIEN